MVDKCPNPTECFVAPNIYTFEYPNGGHASILCSKQGDRYRIQSSTFEGIYYLLLFFDQKLKKFQEASRQFYVPILLRIIQCICVPLDHRKGLEVSFFVNVFPTQRKEGRHDNIQRSRDILGFLHCGGHSLLETDKSTRSEAAP